MKSLKIFIISLLFLVFSDSFAQNTRKIDSLIAVLDHPDAYNNLGVTKILPFCYNIYDLSKKQNYDKGTLVAIQKILAVKMNTSNTDDFEKKLAEGLQLAQKLKDYHALTRLLCYKSSYLSDLGFFQKSSAALKEGLSAAQQIQDYNLRQIMLARVYNYYSSLMDASKAPQDSLVSYSKKAYEAALKISDKDPRKSPELAEKELNMASLSLDMNKLDDAERYLKEYTATIGTNSDPFFDTEFYRISGNLEYKRGNYHKAIEYLKKATELAKANNPRQLLSIYPLLADSYSHLEDFKNSANYSKKYRQISDSINAVQKKSIDNVAVLDDKKEKSKFINDLLPILFALVVCALIIIYFLRKRKTIKSPSIESNENIVLPDRTVDAQQMQALVELAKTNEHAFYLKFSELYPDFDNTLSRYSISPSEQKLCCYMKLKFDNKQIATYTNTTVKSVESKKYRIRKKFGLTEKQDMYSFLDDI